MRNELVVLDGEGGGNSTVGPWLVRPDSLYVRQYPPLAVSNLHRRFARTEPIAESILAFAQGAHGWRFRLEQGMVIGESVAFWKEEIERMARDLPMGVDNERTSELSHLIEWTPQGAPPGATLSLTGSSDQTSHCMRNVLTSFVITSARTRAWPRE